MELELCDDLNKLIGRWLANHKLPQRPEKEDQKPDLVIPKIFLGYLPPKKEDSSDPYPFLLIRVLLTEVQPAFTDITLSFVIGVFAQDSQGYRDAVNLAQSLSNELMPYVQAPLHNKFTMMLPFTWELIEDQPWPYWQLEAKVKWRVNSPNYVYAGLSNSADKFSQLLKGALYD